MTAERAVNRLVERGLIVLNSNGDIVAQNELTIAQNEPKMAQNEPNPKESSKENINKNKSSLSVSKETSRADGRTDFDLFWASFAPAGALRKKKNACRAFFYSKDMCDDWVIEYNDQLKQYHQANLKFNLRVARHARLDTSHDKMELKGTRITPQGDEIQVTFYLKRKK